MSTYDLTDQKTVTLSDLHGLGHPGDDIEVVVTDEQRAGIYRELQSVMISPTGNAIHRQVTERSITIR